ncbi:MAG: ferritin family protein [Chloroflexota bacterium]
MWICRVCKHVVIGLEPLDHCPVCGAGKERFERFEPKDRLTGTRTLANLKQAFAGESQANRRYTAWAHAADLSGDNDAAEAFRKAAEDETQHAHGLLIWMGAVGDARDNLEQAATGEEAEAADFYPRCAAVARDEGLTDLAVYFEALGRQEGQHARKFRDVLAKKADNPRGN